VVSKCPNVIETDCNIAIPIGINALEMSKSLLEIGDDLLLGFILGSGGLRSVVHVPA